MWIAIGIAGATLVLLVAGTVALASTLSDQGDVPSESTVSTSPTATHAADDPSHGADANDPSPSASAEATPSPEATASPAPGEGSAVTFYTFPADIGTAELIDAHWSGSSGYLALTLGAW